MLQTAEKAMLRCPIMGRRQHAVVLSVAALSAVVMVGEGSVFDKKADGE